MEPNACLQEMRALVSGLIAEEPDTFDSSAAHDAVRRGMRLAELVEALDGWLSRGGFCPAAWLADAPAPLEVQVPVAVMQQIVSTLNAAGLVMLRSRRDGDQAVLSFSPVPQEVLRVNR